ncbi:hypothetical protein OG896_11825 [Streptomyces sp. NBC_00669]|uniref:hypothetical protein n=1 Tax=unclassified Streptomyces TaxID=2593676 RepID=UPI002E30F267|nr:hypothetical protein [Streptomyces sp. NBC_00669]
MTAMRSRIGRMAVSAVVLGTVAVASAGCGGGSSGAGKKLDPSGLVKLGDEVAAGKTTTCPVPYRMDKAARSAGLTGHAALMRDKDAVSADTEKGADPTAPVAKAHGVVVYCNYTIGAQETDLTTVATRTDDPADGKDPALSMTLPLIASRAHLPNSRLAAYFAKCLAAKPGTPVLTPSGNVAVVTLPATSGNILLMVDVVDDDAGHIALPAKSVAPLARSLAEQARW